MAIMDVYIRVSRVGGREGEEYRTPHIQRGEIKRWLDREGVSEGKAVVDEEVGGGLAVAERGLEELIKRAERGDTLGVVCYRIDRFGRDHIENILAAKRMKDAGARLVGVADGFDSEQPGSKMTLNFLSIQAEDYLDRVKANWDASTSAAVAEGKHIACRAPIGYLRADQADPHFKANGDLIRDARLVPDPSTAQAVTRAFEMRASGDSYVTILDQLPVRIAKSTLAHMFTNRAYLGEARGPKGVVKVAAHEPLTTEALFRAVRPGKAPKRTGLAAHALLGGLITCAACGHKLRIVGSTARNGERIPIYSCSKRYASGECPEPASAHVRLVDDLVAAALWDSWQDREQSVADNAAAYLEAREAVRLAEQALEETVNDASLPPRIFRQRAAVLQADLEEKQHVLWDMDEPDVDLSKPMVPGTTMIYEVWGDDVLADRRLLRRCIARVELAKADPKRRRWQPIAERVAIAWR